MTMEDNYKLIQSIHYFYSELLTVSSPSSMRNIEVTALFKRKPALGAASEFSELACDKRSNVLLFNPELIDIVGSSNSLKLSDVMLLKITREVFTKRNQ